MLTLLESWFDLPPLLKTRAKSLTPLSSLPHISSLTKSAFFHLRNIARLHPFLNINDAETLVHAFITSRLDYYISLFYGLPNTTINKLQYIQNSAARVLTFSKKSSHILHRLHWLPVHFRIQRYSSSPLKHFMVSHPCIFLISFIPTPQFTHYDLLILICCEFHGTI